MSAEIDTATALKIVCFTEAMMPQHSQCIYSDCALLMLALVNAFKARLDKFWQNQLVKFDFTADLTGTGNRSEVIK